MASPEKNEFNEDVVLVTGSRRGIGEAIARYFGRYGATVIVTDLPEHSSEGQSTAESIREKEGEATFIGADLTKPEDIDYLIEEVVDEYAKIDHVVNNASYINFDYSQNCSLSDWELLMNVNLRAYWLVAKHSYNYMDSGTVTNISSIHATSTIPAAFPYNVSKSGVSGLTRALAIDFGPKIRVNSVEPGQIKVDRNESVINEQDEKIEEAYPLKRLGEKSDITGVVGFLASDSAKFITGANIPVTGGLHCVQPGYWQDFR